MERKCSYWFGEFLKQIDTRRYSDYIINDHYFGKKSLLKRASDMRVSCESLSQIENQQMKKLLITLCNNSTDRYHLNILIIIGIIYHLYIECEL